VSYAKKSADEKKKISGPLNCLSLEKLAEQDLEKHRLRSRQAGEIFAKRGNRRLTKQISRLVATVQKQAAQIETSAIGFNNQACVSAGEIKTSNAVKIGDRRFALCPLANSAGQPTESLATGPQ